MQKTYKLSEKVKEENIPRAPLPINGSYITFLAVGGVRGCASERGCKVKFTFFLRSRLVWVYVHSRQELGQIRFFCTQKGKEFGAPEHEKAKNLKGVGRREAGERKHFQSGNTA